MSASYPAAIDEHLELTSPPACVLCHTSPLGGPGTAQTPFAKELKQLGLKGRGDLTSLLDALDSAEAGAIDSDEDGQPDIEELRAAETLESEGTGTAGAITIEPEPRPQAPTCALEPGAPAPSALAVLLSLTAVFRVLRHGEPHGATRLR